ncbi:MAG: type II secretion system F family protein [Alphaproteobacteria bacterium]|nr:type II secretion system F family protein [Alphaproteobacteria bacterium]
MPKFLSKYLDNPDAMAMLGGGAALVVIALVWFTFVERNPLQRRLKSISERRKELEAVAAKKASRRPDVRQLDFMKQVLGALQLNTDEVLGAVRTKLIRAGYRGRDAVVIFMFIKVAVGLGLGVAAFFAAFVTGTIEAQSSVKLLILLSAIFVGWMAPDFILRSKTKKRSEIIRRAMPDALDLMVICAEAGLSLDATLDRVAREIGNTAPELAEELALTGVELNLMPERSKALQAMADRIALQGVLALVNTLIQTERFGTPLAQALRVLSAEMRDERMMMAEEKAAKLPATLTIPMMIFILPTLFMVLVGPAAIRVLETFRKNN